MKLENQQRERARICFANHVVKIKARTEDIIIIDWKNKDGSPYYYIQYFIDMEHGTLHISGDLGYNISSCGGPVNAEKMVSLVQSVPYWMGKFRATSDDYTFNDSDIEEDLCSIRDEYITNKSEYDFREMSDEEINEDFEELIRIFTEKYEIGNGPYPQEAVDIIEKYDDNWHDSEFSKIGRRINSRVYFWSEGLKMAWEQVKEKTSPKLPPLKCRNDL